MVISDRNPYTGKVIKEVSSAIVEDMEGAFTAVKTAAAQKHRLNSPRVIQTYTGGYRDRLFANLSMIQFL
jgi:acyl-CoA reductase-like NAD-dependent aldehyde dehydrogenase